VWALHGQLVQDLFAKSYEFLSEVATSRSRPPSEAVSSTGLDVDEHARVLEKPRDEGVVDGDAAVDPRLEAEAQCPEHASYEHDTNFYSSI